MAINTVNNKPFSPTTYKKVEESFNSSKDGQSGNFYQKKKQEQELPTDLEELFATIKEEIEKFEKQDYVKEQKVSYKAVKTDEKVYIVVKDEDDEEIRRMEPEEFMRIASSSSEKKGKIIDSVF